jgi:signal transduction histidine kinase
MRRAEESAQIEILQELNRLRSELIANASHELRTPLGLIKVFCTSLLATDVEFDEQTRQQFLRGIDEESDKLKVIVDNLLGLSTLESGRLRLDKHTTDITALVHKVTEDVKVDLQSALINTPGQTTFQQDQAKDDAACVTLSHHFVYDFPDKSLLAPIDAKRIEQVLRNLLSNAVKYSPHGGTITIQGRGDKWQVLLRISDEGIGIPPEDMEHVFERFYRVENEHTRNIGGVGLGLAVCRGIVEAHGGSIWVESTPASGSHFYFTLPVDDSLV